MSTASNQKYKQAQNADYSMEYNENDPWVEMSIPTLTQKHRIKRWLNVQTDKVKTWFYTIKRKL